jgi:DNA-binding GntR family transcriptional regulator
LDDPVPLPNETDQVERVPTRDLIAEQLRSWIVRGQLEPGENLRDMAIAEQLGVSRTPVREALLQLEREGLIETRPQGWTRVALLNPAEFIDAHVIWVNLHALAAKLAAARGERDLIAAEEAQAAMKRKVEELGDSSDRELMLQIVDADDAFHAAIVEASGNLLLWKLLYPLNILIRRYQISTLDQITPIGHGSIAEHDKILETIQAGNVSRAEEAMRLNVVHALPDSLRS